MIRVLEYLDLMQARPSSGQPLGFLQDNTSAKRCRSEFLLAMTSGTD